MNQFPPLSSLSSNPLFSSIVTLYTLILLYFPHIFLKVILSPVLISTAVLLLSLLRLGATQKITQVPIANEESEPGIEPMSGGFDPIPEPDPNRFCSFVEWDVSAPLEVIYEAYEGEEEEAAVNDRLLSGEERACFGASIIERCPSLSRYYPETDSDSSSSDGEFPDIKGWDSPESICFRWDEEEDERDDGLIEIPLDGKRIEAVKEVELLQAEEENLIEIDISPATKQLGGFVVRD